MKAGNKEKTKQNKIEIILTPKFLGPYILTVKLNRSIFSFQSNHLTKKGKKRKLKQSKHDYFLKSLKVLKLLEERKEMRKNKNKERGKLRKGGGTGAGNQWASLLFGDKQVQESSFVICSVVCFLRICILTRRDFEVFLKHMSICRLYPLIVVLLCLNNLKAKLPVEVNC